LVEGVSRRQVLRETGMHWLTLKKILEHSKPPGYRQEKLRPPSSVDVKLNQIMFADWPLGSHLNTSLSVDLLHSDLDTTNASSRHTCPVTREQNRPAWQDNRVCPERLSGENRLRRCRLGHDMGQVRGDKPDRPRKLPTAT
jgi:hypothetical protein